ncbi:MAG: VOC family protein [Caldilineaceae bacterium]|nr:VOC family protein [Caldilineaceae bacterium]
MNPSMRVADVLEFALYVDDLEASQSFYTELLGLPFYSKAEGRHVFLRCGNRMILLFNAEATAVSTGGSTDAPVHGAHGAGHLAFAVRENEIDLWKDHLAENGVEIEREIQFGKSRSIYFRDPSGNSLEIASPRLWGIAEDTLLQSS